MSQESCIQCKQSFFFRSTLAEGQRRQCEKCINLSHAHNSEQREVVTVCSSHTVLGGLSFTNPRLKMLSQCTRCGTTAFPFCKTPVCPTCLKDLGLEDDGKGGYQIDQRKLMFTIYCMHIVTF